MVQFTALLLRDDDYPVIFHKLEWRYVVCSVLWVKEKIQKVESIFSTKGCNFVRMAMAIPIMIMAVTLYLYS